MGEKYKYTPEIVEKAREYLENWENIADNAIPTMAGLATYLDINRDTLYEWEKQGKEKEEKREMTDICARARQIQEQVLISKGLTKKYDNSLTKLLLTRHGYSDRQEVDHRSGDGSMSPTKIEIVAPSEDEKGEKPQ